MAASMGSFVPYSHDEKASNPPVCCVLKFTAVLVVLHFPGMPESFGRIHSNCIYAEEWSIELY